MINLNEIEDTGMEGLLPQPNFPGKPQWPNLAEEEPQNIQQDYLAQERFMESERLQKLYLDQKEFDRLANEPRIREGRKMSLVGDDLPKVALNAAYLSHQLDRDVTSADYQFERDRYAASVFGQDKVNDAQFFDLVKGEYDVRQQKTAALDDLRLKIAGQTLEDAISGKETPAGQIWTAWRDQYKDLVGGDNELPYMAAAVADRDQFRAIATKYKDLAGPGLNLLRKFTTGEASQDELSDFARTLTTIPREEQDTVINLIALGADAGQIDRGSLKEFALAMGQTFSRGFNFIPKRVMQDRELGVTNYLEALESGVEVYIPIGGTISEAVVGNAPAGAAEEALAEGSWRQATPEEREQMISTSKGAIEAFRVERQLRAVADNNVDPIKRLAPKDSFAGWVEGSVQGVVGSLPLLSAAALNPVASVVAYQALEYDRMMLENTDMDARAAFEIAGIEGTWQAALDLLQLRTLAGALPVTGRLLGQIKSSGVRNALRIPASVLEQVGQEYAQDLGTLAIDAVASAVREDMKDKDFGVELADYWKNQAAETFGASLIFGLWGGGVVRSRDLKGSPAQWDEAARIVGISEEGRRRMQAATTPEELDAVVEREMKSVTPEARAAGALYAKAKTQAAAAQQADPNEPTLEVTKDADGNAVYRITTPDNQVLVETTDSQAAQAAFLDYRTASENNEVQALREVIDYWQKRDPKLSISEAPGVLVTDELTRLEGIGDAAGIERLRQRLTAADINPDGDLTGVQIFGSATVEEVGENVYRGTIMVREGASPETVLEEVNHVFVRRALMRGDVTLDQLSGWLDQTAAATGLDIKRGNELEIIESIAQVGMDLFNGRLDQAQLPQSFVDYLRRLMRVIKEIYVRAVKVTEAFDKGEIDSNFESFLMESMGMSPQQQVELNSTTTAAAVATGQPVTDFSVGRMAQGMPDAADYSIGITVAPLRRDTLTELSKKELGKRARSAKFIHLQQVVDDITAAYGVGVLSRQPVIGTWTEKGQVSLEVPEAIIVDSDDLDLAEEMAALIAISAPELQNGAMVWRDDPQGSDVIVTFKAKSAEAAMVIAEQFNNAGVMGSSYDVNTRTFSVAMVGATAEDIKQLTDYVDYHTGQGRLTPGQGAGKSYQFRAGSGKFPGEAEYRSHLQAARNRADQLGLRRGAALRDVVDRAERRLKRQVAATKIAGKARRALKKITQPQTAAARIEAELKGRSFDNIRQLGLYLDARFRKVHGKPAFEVGSQEGIDQASDALLYDILDGLSTDGSGMGWYDERVQETIRELAKQHPEFADDPLALSVYIGILASTSQGYTVVENFKQADRVYAVYKATGRMPTDLDFAKANEPINSNLAQIQELIDSYGLEGYAEFMDAEVTGRALRDQYGMQPTGVTLQDVVRGNRVLGPKIGSFFNNLRGRFDTITMDLWYTRTMHRYLGETVVPLESEKMQNAVAKFRTELKKKGARTYGIDLKAALKNDEATVQAALTLFQRWARGNNEYAEKGYMKFKDGYAVEKAARTIFASGGMKGAPQNKTHRNYFAKVVLEAKDKLAKLGFKLTEADMQAVVWYREKNLFGRTGVANAAAKPADYLDAVMVARRKAEAAKEDLAEPMDLSEITEDFSVGRPRVNLAAQLEELQAGESAPVDTSKTFWLIASSEGDIVEILDNEQDATAYFQTTASSGDWLWEYKDGLRTKVPLLKRGVAERRAEGYIDTVRYEQDEAQGRVLYYGADKSAETTTSAGEIPSHTPDGRVWAGQEESVVYHGGQNLDPQGTDPGGYGTTQTLKPRRPSQTYLFSLGRPRVDRALSAALNAKPGERLAMYERAKEMFDRVAARRGAETGASGYARTLQSLWELDAILKVLPAEVRGKVGGFTQIAALEPTDLYRGEELVTESNSPAGARIAAWMREGLNIGEAGKKTDLPEGYSTRRAVDPARATKATDDFLVKRLATVGKQLDRYLAAEYRIAIERALEAAKPKRSESGVRKSTLGPETQAYADKALAASKLDNDQTAARLAAIEAELLNPETTDEKKIDLVEEWGLVNTLGDLENRNAETLAQAHAELKDRLKAGRAGWRIQEEARIAAQRETVASILNILGEPTKAKRFATKSQIQKLGELLTSAGLDHRTFEQFLRAVIPDDVLVARWADMLRKADTGAQDMELALREQLLEVAQAAAKTAGMSRRAALAMLKRPAQLKVRARQGRKVADERISIELARKIVNGTADRSNLSQGDVETLREALDALPADTRKEFVTIQRVISAGNPVEISMTPAQAMQLELSWDQPDVQDKMRREGWTDESIADIRAITSQPVAAETLAFLRKFYAENYATVNPVYARMFGMNMPQGKFYAPSRFLSAGAEKEVSLDGSPMSSGSTPGFAKARVSHSAPIAPEDALTVFQQHVAQTAHWVNFAEFAREARGVVNNLQVQESIRQQFGDGAVNSLKSWVELLEQRGGNKSREIAWLTKSFGSVLGGTAISSLGFNLKTVFIQLDSAMRFMLAMDPRQIGSALSNPVALAASMPKIWFSPSIQRRLKGGMNPAVQLLFARDAAKPGPLSSLAWLSMQPIQIFDAAATTISSAMVFRASFNDAKAAGMNDAAAEAVALEAVDAAIYRYSQPTGFGSKSLMENSGNVFAKVWMLFLSDPRLKTGVLVDAVSQIGKGKDIGMNLQRIAAIEAMALVSHVIASAYRDAFSDDEDEDIWSVGGFAQALALAPLQGFFVVGTMSELALRKLFGEQAFARNRDPFVNTAESAIRAVAGWEKLLYPEDAAEGLKAWNTALRGIAFSTPLGAPAALLNIIKPFIGWQENQEADE